MANCDVRTLHFRIATDHKRVATIALPFLPYRTNVNIEDVVVAKHDLWRILVPYVGRVFAPKRRQMPCQPRSSPRSFSTVFANSTPSLSRMPGRMRAAIVFDRVPGVPPSLQHFRPVVVRADSFLSVHGAHQ